MSATPGGCSADEYVDRGESARSADRPAFKAMLARIAEDRDIDAVVVHKIDRLARNMEDHVAIRALFRRRGVALVSVTENVEETASGRLVEGIHALMAEFYSANLASEIKKGLNQKAKLGGFPHGAPLGYLNLREVIGGRQVARIVPDPERAPLITGCLRALRHGRMDPATSGWRTGPPGPHQPGPTGQAPRPDHLAGTGQDPRQPRLHRDRGVERRPVPGHPRTARHPRGLPPGPGTARGTRGTRAPASASTPTT